MSLHSMFLNQPKNRYINGVKIKPGDVFTEGLLDSRREERLAYRMVCLYADKFIMVAYPLSDVFKRNGICWEESTTTDFITSPQKIELSDLTAEELERYKTRNKILNPRLTKKK